MDFLPAIQFIEKAKHVGLILAPDANHDILVSAETIARFLASRAIYTGLVTPLNHAAAACEKSASTLASLKPLTKEFIISLDISQAPISQLRYEQGDKRVDIILSPSSYADLSQHISFRAGKIQCDVLITLGVPDMGSLDINTLGIAPSFLSDTPVIAFDISPAHKRYGKINLVDSSFSSVAELVYRFFAAIPEHTIPQENATLLLSGIISRTRTFTVLANADTLLSGHELIKMGADHETARALIHDLPDMSLAPLLGRALARSKIDTDKKITWSSLTRDDFSATCRSPRDISDILGRLEKEFLGNQCHVLLWQDPDTSAVHAHLAAHPSLQETITRHAHARPNGAHLELTDTYESFSEAEQAVSALLDQAL